MGINVSCKTTNKASLKLFNAIASFLFEQEYDELKGKPTLKKALMTAKDELIKNIRS